MPSARSPLPGYSMVWKAFWDTPRGDGMLFSLFVPKMCGLTGQIILH